MTAIEIAREIETVLDFYGHRKHTAVAIDVVVLREAVRELRASVQVHRRTESPKHSGLARVTELSIAGSATA